MLIEAGQTPQSPALGESPVKARGVMVQFHPFRDVAKENIHGWIKGFLIRGGVQTLVQKRLLNFFMANYF